MTHTAKAQLPPLETVDEKDLPGEFWSVSAYQRPRHRLNGIKADDLRKKQRQMGVPPISTSSRPTSRNSRSVSPLTEEEKNGVPYIPTPVDSIASLDSTMFDEAKETRFDPDNGVQQLQPARQVMKYPKRFSSLQATNERHGRIDSLPRNEASYETCSSVASCTSEAPSEPLLPIQNFPEEPRCVSPFPDADISENAPSPHISPVDDVVPKDNDIAFRSTQPLPPLPDQNLLKKRSTNSLRSAAARRHSSLAMKILSDHPVSPTSKRSSKGSACKSQTCSDASDVRESMVLSDATWEDDVDFCYEQEAESTCNFNWDVGLSARNDSVVQPPKTPYHAHSPDLVANSESSVGLDDSTATMPGRRNSQLQGQHTREKSVGHRGFLAARKSSNDLKSMAKSSPASIRVTPNLAHVSVLSPVFSISGTEEEASPKAPLTPGGLGFAGLEGVNTESLSDPESCRNSGSSRHRKSSSYSSHGSSVRAAPSAVREAHRWSVASANSLPDLMHSRPRSKLSLSKTMGSRPLESLPQSPGFQDGGEVEASTMVPPRVPVQSARESFVTRKPQTPGDRASLQPTGRRASRGTPHQRAGTSHLSSRGLQPGQGVREAEMTGPEWI